MEPEYEGQTPSVAAAMIRRQTPAGVDSALPILLNILPEALRTLFEGSTTCTHLPLSNRYRKYQGPGHVDLLQNQIAPVAECIAVVIF